VCTENDGDIDIQPQVFQSQEIRDPCAWRNVLTVHKIQPQELIEGWGKLKNNEC
jgi:hypothetical protein